MTFSKSCLLVIVALFSICATAHQDDAQILLRKPLFLFDGNVENETHFLTDYAVRANLGSFFATDKFHSWGFGAGFDTSLASFSDSAIWRFGLNLDVVADDDNSIKFRLAQTHYEVFTAFEFKIDDSVAYLGYRHRCRHAADKTDARIIMKSGVEVGFNGFNQVGPIALTWFTSATGYVWGQNDDLSHQHRLNLSGTLQAEYAIGDTVGVFGSAGLSAVWVTKGATREYTLFSAPLESDFRFSPGASLGVNLKGTKGDFKTYLAYASNLDAGFRAAAEQTHLVSINGEFWF